MIKGKNQACCLLLLYKLYPADFFFISPGYGTRGNTRRPQTEIVIYYNDDYFIPEFDSRSLAEIFQGYYNEFHDEWTVVLVKSDAFDLKDAMVPAVKGAVGYFP
mgnify:CR=1 FL=1